MNILLGKFDSNLYASIIKNNHVEYATILFSSKSSSPHIISFFNRFVLSYFSVLNILNSFHHLLYRQPIHIWF